VERRSSGLDLLNALQNVLDAQNDLVGIWVSYETARLNIYLSTGMLQVDERGLWTDPFYQNGLRMTDSPENESVPPVPLPGPERPAPADVRGNSTARSTVPSPERARTPKVPHVLEQTPPLPSGPIRPVNYEQPAPRIASENLRRNGSVIDRLVVRKPDRSERSTSAEQSGESLFPDPIGIGSWSVGDE